MSDPPPREDKARLEELYGMLADASTADPVGERVGRLAIMKGHITAEQLQDALTEQRRQRSEGGTHQLLGEILLKRGAIDPTVLSRLLLEQTARAGGVPQFRRYDIRERIGEGALAYVFRAEDRELDRPVALKVLKDLSSLNPAAQERVRREAKALARLSHPNVVAVYDAGEDNGQVYVAMELVRGKSLNAVLKEDRPELARILGLLRQVAEGVHHAHEHGIVHRDLKPDNILVAESGEAKVADFGLAHLVGSGVELTHTGAKLGTPLYMAPEQAEGRGREVTPRTDVYALGAILYEVLTGRPPHGGESLTDVFANILSREPAPPRQINSAVPPDLQTVALKALEKDPARRYATAREFGEDLRRNLAGEPIAARPAGWMYRSSRRVRKNPVAWALGVGVVGIATAALALWFSSVREREASLTTLREMARMSLDTALRFRRAGANDQMREYVPRLEAAYRECAGRAPRLAEPEYLMGRMHRVLMEDDKALEYQERALGKDPDYAPALYERIVLLSKKYGVKLTEEFGSRQAIKAERVTAEEAEKIPEPTWDEAERGRQDLVRAKQKVLDDCERLERIQKEGRRYPDPIAVSEANVMAARGIVAMSRMRPDEALEPLLEAVKKDPYLEEAWETLGESAWMRSRRSTGDARLDLYREAVRYCTEGLRIDRGYWPHLIKRGGILHSMGDALKLRGLDPLPAYAGAEDDVREAMRLDKAYRKGPLRLGELHQKRAAYRILRGEDPSADFEAAIMDFSEAVRLNPVGSSEYKRRGSAFLDRGTYLLNRGEDPIPDFEAGELDLRRCLQLEEKSTVAFDALGILLFRRGTWLERRAEDPSREYGQAVEAHTEAIRIEAFEGRYWARRGQARAALAFYRAGRGQDAISDLQGAKDDFDRAVKLNARYVESIVQRGHFLSRSALLREKAGDRDRAERDLAGAVADFETAIQIDPAKAAELREPLKSTQEKLAALKRP